MENDLISRQAALDALKQQAETMKEWHCRYAEQRKGILSAVNIVKDLPPAQPEYTEQDVRDSFNSGYACGIEATQPETATITIGKTRGTDILWYQCDGCGEPVAKEDCYCSKCGRRLRFEQRLN